MGHASVQERSIQVPNWHLQIGEYSVERLVRLELVSARQNPFDVVTLAIDNAEGGSSEELVEGLPIFIAAGDRSAGVAPVFSGRVEEVQPGRILTITARDAMALVADKKVTRTWTNVTPQEVARVCLRDVGIDFTLHDAELKRRHMVTARGRSVLALLQEMDAAWQLGWDLYCHEDGTLWWGPWEESPRYKASLEADMPVFVHGESLLGLEPSGTDTGQLRSWLQPDIRHSQLIGIQDDRLWRQQVVARVERVRHVVGAGGLTELEWRVV